MAHLPTFDRPPPAVEPSPTRRQSALFFGKTWGLRLVRFCRDTARGSPRRFPPAHPSVDTPLLAESRGRLYTGGLPAEFALQSGKVQNLRLAAAALHGVTVPPGAIFSFWAHVPRPTRHRGFAPGRELREGCIIPSVGGGLCQLSNALYDAALTAGFNIVERHAHSRRLPGSMAAVGRDATVFWNYVDLRFRPPGGCRIETILTRTELVVRLRAPSPAAPAPFPLLISPPPRSHDPPNPGNTRPSQAADAADAPPELLRPDQPGPGTADLPPVESCETCDAVACFRHPGTARAPSRGLTAWLVDGWWPEFDRHLQSSLRENDQLFLPLDGTRFRLRRYRWQTTGFRRVTAAPRETLLRAWQSRRLAAQGASRQQTLLRFDAALAARYARTVPPAAAHLVVSQNLLPFLWRSGALGGRTFDVLMTRLPLTALQRTLDRAAARHPDSPTLADFRADPALLAAEDAALSEAARWITPHAGVARLAGSRAHLLRWHLPARPSSAPGSPALSSSARARAVLFPASTLGRKGAYELRAVVRELALGVHLGGPVLESADFWRGVKVLPPSPSAGMDIRAVVLPAWVEHQPRRLLGLLGTGLPVIASEACGLADVPGVVTVPTGDVAALHDALRPLLGPADP